MNRNGVHIDGMHQVGPVMRSEQSINDLAMDIIRKKEAWLAGVLKDHLPAEVFNNVQKHPGMAKKLLDELKIHMVEKPNGLTELYQDKTLLSSFKLEFKPL